MWSCVLFPKLDRWTTYFMRTLCEIVFVRKPPSLHCACCICPDCPDRPAPPDPAFQAALSAGRHLCVNSGDHLHHNLHCLASDWSEARDPGLWLAETLCYCYNFFLWSLDTCIQPQHWAQYTSCQAVCCFWQHYESSIPPTTLGCLSILLSNEKHNPEIKTLPWTLLKVVII